MLQTVCDTVKNTTDQLSTCEVGQQASIIIECQFAQWRSRQLGAIKILFEAMENIFGNRIVSA
ncbi:hypothetical protein [Paraburkholderia domus]|uniref:hypothetical protein n=1 Tax=Paraburkholderia domus TaxID=2793075 RepID=UPI0019147920|nr:hypothetical protein [Paraburkholderia domus]MBK5054406.1 hypothetical protein [Burkholderia sp. R-70006]MBK5066092.1 hypothetical protein [Burkholderia sp. R-70199]MBK5169732.1 hypothetical protein [Burkholderia sp. R-70211]MBK5185433.1 hypothetical protein [Burkholderia sp. R-69749]